MRSLLSVLFLLLLPIVQGSLIAVSPPAIELDDQGTGSFHVLNSNGEERMFEIESPSIALKTRPSYGSLMPGERKRIQVESRDGREGYLIVRDLDADVEGLHIQTGVVVKVEGKRSTSAKIRSDGPIVEKANHDASQRVVRKKVSGIKEYLLPSSVVIVLMLVILMGYAVARQR